jgi:hypothetical protein
MNMYRMTRVWTLVGAKDFLLASASRLDLGPTQPPIQWVLEVHSPGVKHGLGMMTLTIHSHLVLRSRSSRSYTSSTPTSDFTAGTGYRLGFYNQLSVQLLVTTFYNQFSVQWATLLTDKFCLSLMWKWTRIKFPLAPNYLSYYFSPVENLQCRPSSTKFNQNLSGTSRQESSYIPRCTEVIFCVINKLMQKLLHWHWQFSGNRHFSWKDICWYDVCAHAN